MFGWAFPASFHPLRALLIYRNQPLKPTLTFDTIDRQRDRTKKLYRMLKEPLGTAKHLSEQSKDFIGYSKRCAIACIKKKLDEMGLDEMGINRDITPYSLPIAFSFPEILHATRVSTNTVLIQSLMHPEIVIIMFCFFLSLLLQNKVLT